MRGLQSQEQRLAAASTIAGEALRPIPLSSPAPAGLFSLAVERPLPLAPVAPPVFVVSAK
jgi:hypothetical protein